MVTVEIALAAIGAGVAVGAAGLSSGIGAGIAGAAGAGAIAEDPDKFSTALIFQALPQTQGIYGFLIAILILMGTGLLGATGTEISIGTALACLGAGVAVGFAGLSAIGQGIVAGSGIGATVENEKMMGKGMVFSVLPETQAIYGMLIAILILLGAGVLGGAAGQAISTTIGFAGIGAGIAVGVAGLSAIGQGIAASAGVGAVSEKEDMFGKGMVFSVLPETQALYGFIIAILILAATGLIGAGISGELNSLVGVASIAAGCAVGLAGLSAIGQGIVAGGAIGASAKNADATGKGLVLSVIPETYAIFGLLIAILIMLGAGMFGG